MDDSLRRAENLRLSQARQADFCMMLAENIQSAVRERNEKLAGKVFDGGAGWSYPKGSGLSVTEIRRSIQMLRGELLRLSHSL